MFQNYSNVAFYSPNYGENAMKKSLLLKNKLFMTYAKLKGVLHWDSWEDDIRFKNFDQ